MQRTTILALAVLLANASVASAADRVPPVVHEDVTYRIVDGDEMKLDIAVPAGAGTHPAIVFLHGGGWIAGDRIRFRDEIERAAWRGYVAATVSYHLAKTGPGDPSVDGFPLPLQDVKAAIRFLRANASDYHIDGKRIGICGESAGGHLALMAALTRPTDGLDGDVPAGAPSSEVQAVANVFGPTDLTALAKDNPVTKPGLVILMGAVPELIPDDYRKASPVTYARRDAPPILTIHGSVDDLVPVSQARSLDLALKRVGAKHTLLVLDGAGHGFWGANAARSGQAVYAFFEKTLKP